MSRARAAVLVSGRGSNLGALIEAARDPGYPAEIALVFSNVEGAGGLAKAEAAGIATRVLSHRGFPTREAFDAELDAILRAADISLIVEAGFMRIHSDWFVRRWEGRIVNIHPSLLPSFKGTKVHEQALAAGVRVSGCTVHFLVTELDSGPIIAQAAVPVETNDTPETLAARVLEAEHRLYPEAVRMLAEGRVRLHNGRAVFAA